MQQQLWSRMFTVHINLQVRSVLIGLLHLDPMSYARKLPSQESTGKGNQQKEQNSIFFSEPFKNCSSDINSCETVFMPTPPQKDTHLSCSPQTFAWTIVVFKIPPMESRTQELLPIPVPLLVSFLLSLSLLLPAFLYLAYPWKPHPHHIITRSL